jgi:pyrroline-5-carboxylate reductase
MAKAISAGLNSSGLIPFSDQAAYDVLTDSLLEQSSKLGFKAAASNPKLCALSDLLILAVKPHQVRSVLSEISPFINQHLVISIAAGVKLETLSSLLPPGTPVVRVIPNLPALVGQGVTLMCADEGIAPERLARAKKIFEAVGAVFELSESLFNEGTAVSGSGPAFFFAVMEAMIRGAVRLGITWDMARELVIKTALGSAALAEARSDLNLAHLRDQVTSPGGTTAEGLLELEEGGLTALFHRALEAAADKGRKLA